MKELVKNSRVIGYLEKMYRQLNIDKFNGELEECVITVQSTPRSFGHVTCSKVWKIKDANRYELNIAADYLNRPIENVVSTLLHEMVHIYNMMHDTQDTSRGYTYHNKHFKEKAESVGLIVTRDDKIGWSITNPSEDLINYIIKQGWSDIAMTRSTHISSWNGTETGGHQGGSNDPDTEKKPSSTRKYQCPCCGISVRATKFVRIACYDCSELMELVS